MNKVFHVKHCTYKLGGVGRVAGRLQGNRYFW